MREYLKNELIQEFIRENGITEEDLYPYLIDIKTYVNNTNDYIITWSFGLNLIRSVRKNNSGVDYVFNPLFDKNITLSELDIRDNSSKINVLSKIKENPTKGVFLTGPNGCGKTYLLVGLANEYYKKYKVKTLYITMPELVYQSFAFKDNHTIINKICNAERLIIDEVGNERISEWSRDSILLPIITKRVDKNLYTSIISNYSIDELSQRYMTKNGTDSKSVKTLISKMSSLADRCIVDGKDYRNEK